MLWVLLQARAKLLDRMPLVTMLCPPSMYASNIRITISIMTIFSENGGEQRPLVFIGIHIRPGGVPTTATSCPTAEHVGHAWTEDLEAAT